MRFFFPDSHDQVDPNFDFVAEKSSEFRVRQRDDRYAHEILSRRPYDGLLVSKPIVDGLVGASAKYTFAQRHRLYRLGVKGFFRLDHCNSAISAMGDCGAFSYVREERPPYSVDDVVDFYVGCGFDYGVSVDHVILGYDQAGTGPQVPAWVQRQQLTLDLASEFVRVIARRGGTVIPIGVAQGWNPQSYAKAVTALQRMGYTYIALGGMVSLKTPQIEECLRAVSAVREPGVTFHLLGVTRVARLADFASYGVVSFDSTSPFRQAFKDEFDNYYTPDRSYVAIRVPQSDGNLKVKGLIRAGRLDQDRARRAEDLCLQRLVQFDRQECSQGAVLDAVRAYACLVDPGRDRTAQYAELLDRAPWKECSCGICDAVGIQVAIFRGTERNKRRGFHNLYVFGQRLAAAGSPTDCRVEPSLVSA